jgi:hypothetical protein
MGFAGLAKNLSLVYSYCRMVFINADTVIKLPMLPEIPELLHSGGSAFTCLFPEYR